MELEIHALGADGAKKSEVVELFVFAKERVFHVNRAFKRFVFARAIIIVAVEMAGKEIVDFFVATDGVGGTHVGGAIKAEHFFHGRKRDDDFLRSRLARGKIELKALFA